jgi:uncharacterized protein (TIGR03435 family)
MRSARGPVVVSLLIASVLNTNSLRAQSPSAGTPAFVVTSIKANKSRDTFKGVQAQPGGRFTVTNMTLRELIGIAYEIPPPLRKARMSGGPAWMDADRFDIMAKANGNLTLSQHLVLLRTLLADRFKLVAKIATREMPVYALVVARSDRKLGPQLRKVPDVDCVALRAASRGLPAAAPPNPTVAGPCSFRAENRGLIMSGATTMADLVRVAFPRMIQDRVVVDRTGLVGSYSVNVEWTPDPEPFASAGDLPPGLPVPPPPTNGGISIFTALQEQLGLKLEPARAPVQVLVIDRAEKPTED